MKILRRKKMLGQRKPLSIFRAQEYKALSSIKINGTILDIGSAKNADYHQLIKGEHHFVTVNNNKNSDSHLYFDIEHEFPLEDNQFDAIICLNVLEHVFDYQNVLKESLRVLKKGGMFIGATPFLFRVHMCPDDYFRYSQSALNKMFRIANFSEISVTPLGDGIFDVLCQLKMGLYRSRLIKIFTIYLAVILNKALRLVKKSHMMSEQHMPLGYFFIAKK